MASFASNSISTGAVLLAGLLAANVSTASGEAPAQFANLAPTSTALSIHVDDFTALRETFHRSMYGALWADPAIRSAAESLVEAVQPDWRKTVETFGVRIDDLAAPTGFAGAALWFALERGDADQPSLAARWLVAADFGAVIERAWTAVADALDAAEESHALEVLPEERAGVDALSARVLVNEDAEEPNQNADEGDEQEDEWDDVGVAPFGLDQSQMARALIDALSRMFSEAHVARVGGVILVAANGDDLEDAILRLRGDGGGPALAGEQDYRDRAAALDDADVFALARFAPVAVALGDYLAALNDEDALAERDQAVRLFDALGLSAMRSVAAGLRLDRPGGGSDLTLDAAVKGRPGVFSLLDAPALTFDPPAFVAPDASLIAQGRLTASALPAIVRQAMAAEQGADDPQAAQMQMIVESFLAQLAPAIAALGNEFVSVSRIAKPYSPQSQTSLLALRVQDEAALLNLVAQYAPMLRMTERDFLGRRLWETPTNPLAGAAIVISDGWALLGSPDAVRAAVQRGADPGARRIADSTDFARARRALGADGVAYSFERWIESQRWALWQARNLREMLRAQWQAIGLEVDERELEDMVEAAIEQTGPLGRLLMDDWPIDAIARHVGDLALRVAWTSDGLRLRALQLPAP